MSNWYQRGLHFVDKNGKADQTGKKLYDSMSTGQLAKLVKIVKSSDDYVLLIRDDYFNVYYKGGNVAEVHSENCVYFDKYYFRKHKNREDEDSKEIENNIKEAVSLFKSGDYEAYFNKIISAMENYFSLGLKSDEEKECQHNLCICNTFDSDSDYAILDLEYEVSTKSPFAYCDINKDDKEHKRSHRPRFDIVAVRKSDGKLCIMELKKGIKALRNKSGIGEHAKSYENSVGKSSETKKIFTDEMRTVLQQMHSLKLIPRDLQIHSDDVEYMFVMQEKNSEPTKNQFEVFEKAYTEELDKVGIKKDYNVIKLHDGDYKLIG